MRQADMIDPELPLAGGSTPPGPLWAQECRSCGHRQRYIDHACGNCGSMHVIGRSRADFDAHRAALAAFEHRGARRQHHAPPDFALTAPEPPRAAPQPAAPAETPALLALMERTDP